MSRSPKKISRKEPFDPPLSRSEIMRRVGQRDTRAELALRSALHRRGLRFRVNRRTEGVKVDIVFVRARVAVFVDGCFWHCCPEHAAYPKSNEAYWLPKLRENQARDIRQADKLRAAGWQVIRVWEHECLPPSPKSINCIEKTCKARLPRK